MWDVINALLKLTIYHRKNAWRVECPENSSLKACTKSPTLLLSLSVDQNTAATQHSFLLQNHLNHKTGYCKTLLFHTIDCVVFYFSLTVSSLPHEDNVKTTTSATQTKTQEKNKHTHVLRQTNTIFYEKKIIFMFF